MASVHDLEVSGARVRYSLVCGASLRGGVAFFEVRGERLDDAANEVSGA
jgi:hypothetical protein